MSSDLESILMRRKKSEMVRFLTEHPEYFEETINVALTQQQPFCWRAAWIVGGCMKKNDPRVTPYISKIIEVLPELEDGHQRELLKILIQLDLAEEHEGQLLDLAIEIWEQVRKQPGVRHFAFRIMFEAIKKYPELTNEILMLTQPQYVNSLSPGIKNSILKMKRAVENSIS